MILQAAAIRAWRRMQAARAAAFFSHRCLPAAFTGWREALARRKHHRAILLGCLAPLRSRALQTAWRSWRGYIAGRQLAEMVRTTELPQ